MECESQNGYQIEAMALTSRILSGLAQVGKMVGWRLAGKPKKIIGNSDDWGLSRRAGFAALLLVECSTWNINGPAGKSELFHVEHPRVYL